MKKTIISLFIFLSLISHAENDLFSSKSIRCSFLKGTATVIRQGEKNWTSKEIKESYELVFDNIDLINNKAREIGNNVARTVEVNKSNLGFTFIDSSKNSEIIIGDGYLTTVIVTSAYSQGNGFPVVLSRTIFSMSPSFGTFDISLGAQYFGFCKSM